MRDYVHAADVRAGVRLALTTSVGRPDVIGSGHSLSVLEVSTRFAAVTGAELDVRARPRRAGRDAGRDRRSGRGPAAGWSPQYSFEDGLEGVWEEWSRLDLDAVAAGVGAVGAPR